MTVELSNHIQEGKEAITSSKFDEAIDNFEKAVEIASKLSPSLQGIIGIAYAFMALAYGKKKETRKGNYETLSIQERMKIKTEKMAVNII